MRWQRAIENAHSAVFTTHEDFDDLIRFADSEFLEDYEADNIDIGSGMVTIALASLLIGNVFFNRTRPLGLRALGAVIGAILFRLVYALALLLRMPAYMLKLVSSVIVVIAISGPYLRSRLPLWKRQLNARRKGGAGEC